jgi:AcrR family transcriptional regulator
MPITIEPLILDAAAELFAERGFRAVTLEDIASHAQVHLATVCRLFKTKEALFDTVFAREWTMANAKALPDHVIENATDMCEVARLYAACIAQALNRRVMRLYLQAAMFGKTVLKNRVAPMTLAMMRAVRAGQEKGEVIAGDPKDIVCALQDAVFGHAVLYAVNHPTVNGDGCSCEALTVFAEIWARGVHTADCQRCQECKWRASEDSHLRKKTPLTQLPSPDMVRVIHKSS